MTKYLAFDIGASSGRGIIGKLENSTISLEEISRFPNSMIQVAGSCHWDILSILGEIKEGIRKAVSQNQIPLSIGIDTWGVDYGLLDISGNILELPYAYRDHRTDNAMEEVFALIPKKRLYRLTGIQFMQFNTIFQLYSALRDTPHFIKKAKDLLFIPDLLNYFLSGIKKTEFSFATTSQLYNPETKKWDQEIFDAIGVSSEIMQDIVDPGTVIGRLSKEVQEETGMPCTDIIAVASHDTGSAIAAVPAEDENFAYISSGTWSLMGIETREPVISAESLKYNFTNEGGVKSSFRVLKNIMGLWLIQECRRSWANAGKDYSDDGLVEMALASKAFKTIIDPDHPSLLNPENMLEAVAHSAKESGEPELENPGEFSRSIFQSLAFRYRRTLDEIKQISDKEIHKIHVVGGGSQNALLCQFTANATGLPVVAGPLEATALGNLMVQVMAYGKVKSLSEIRKVIRNSFTFKEYLPENVGAWESNYSRFLDICDRN